MKTKKGKVYRVTAKVWLYPGESANWHFITIPKPTSKEMKETHGAHARGWGSLPVSVTMGETTWTTSIFPDAQSGTYLLPLKAQVRRKEGLFEGDTVTLTCTILA
jgi:hypothetical protein